MPTPINITVSDPASDLITVVVSDTNNEHITVTVSDVIAGSGQGGGAASVIVFEGIVGGTTSLTGTTNTLSGFDEDSDMVTLSAFIGKRVEIIRGGQDTPSIGPNAGFTKDLVSDSILLTDILEDGEYLKIKTIP